MQLKSNKRSYMIFLDDEAIVKILNKCNNMTKLELQVYIDLNFRKSSKLASDQNDRGKWDAARKYKDYAKIGILVMDDKF